MAFTNWFRWKVFVNSNKFCCSLPTGPPRCVAIQKDNSIGKLDVQKSTRGQNTISKVNIWFQTHNSKFEILIQRLNSKLISKMTIQFENSKFKIQTKIWNTISRTKLKIQNSKFQV